MIQIEKLSKRYGNETVLHQVDLHIEKGEFVFLRGASGSGKTTLLKILNRELNEYDGTVTLAGRPLSSYPKQDVRRIATTIFQSYELLEQKTALENVLLAGEVVGRPKKILLVEAKEALSQVGLAGKEHRFPHELSGGEQQRVAIARAILNRPSCLLADEPTGNLDPDNARAIMELLQTINQTHNMTMVIVTHSDELSQAFPHRLITIEKGVVTR